MSCFATIKSPATGANVTSSTYYQLTSFFPEAQAKEIYSALTTDTFKTELGFDWTKKQYGYSPKLNHFGEPTIHEINKHLRLKMTELQLKQADQIQEVSSLGYLNVGFANEKALETIQADIQLNPKFDSISSEVITRDGKYYLSVKPSTGKKVHVVSKQALKKLGFPDMILDNIQDFNNASLKELITSLENSNELEDFQKNILKRLNGLMKINPSLELAIFDDSGVDEDQQRSFYNPENNTVYISKTLRTNFDNKAFAATLIHEVVHAYTIHALNNPTTSEELKFSMEMQKYYSTYVRNFPHLQNNYGFKNIEEFVSEFLSNPYFRDALQEAQIKTSKDKTFIGRVVSSIKNFLKDLLGKDQNIFDLQSIQNTIDEYFDYLNELEDMPELPSEHYLRFSNTNSQFGAPKTKSKIDELQNFIDYIEQHSNSKIWAQLSQSLSEISPEFKSIEKIKQAFGNISSADITGRLTNTVKYLDDLQSLLAETIKQIELVNKNSANYESDYSIRTFNNGILVAQALLEQLNIMSTDLISRLTYPIYKNSYESERLEAATNLLEAQRQIPNYTDITESLTKAHKKAKEMATKLLNDSKEYIMDPAAVEIARMFEKVVADAQEDSHPIHAEIAYLENNIKKAEKAGNKRVQAALQEELEIKQKYLTMVPSKENILNLMRDAHDPKLKNITMFSRYWGIAGMSGIAAVDIMNSFINIHLTEAGNESMKTTARAMDLEKRIRERNKRKGISINNSTGRSFYKGFYRDVETVYYDEDGKRRTISQLAYNTKMKEAEFQSDLLDLKNELKLAEQSGDESRIDAAEKALEQFVTNYAERPYTDEYYQAAELLTEEAKEAQQHYLDLIASTDSVFGDDELSADSDVKQLRASYKREYQRLGSIYNADGSEKPVGSKERNIAESIIAYKKARKNLDVLEFTIPETTMVKFKTIKASYEKNVKNAQSEYNTINADYEEAVSKQDSAKQSVLEIKLEEAKAKLDKVKLEQKNWLNANTRIEIDPKFFERQRAISDKIKTILEKYNTNPEISEKYEKLFSTVKGFRDHNGNIVGSELSPGLAKTVHDIEQSLEDLKFELKQSTEISEEDKKELKKYFTDLFNLQTKENTDYYKDALESLHNNQHTEVIADAQLVRQFREKALEAAKYYQENDGEFNDPSIFDFDFSEDDLPQAVNKDTFKTEMYFNDLVDAFEKILINKEVSKRVKESDWYRNNHITVSYERSTSITNPLTGEKTYQTETVTEERPTYIWRKTVPRDAKYIKQDSPSFDWATHRVRDVFKNKDYNFLGDHRPRQNAVDSKYVNEAYTNLEPDEKSIMDDMVTLYEDIQRPMPRSQRLSGYVVPNEAKSHSEKNVDLKLNTPYRIKTWFSSFMMAFREAVPGAIGGVQEVEDSILDTNRALYKLNTNSKARLIKTRYKEPLNRNQVSYMLTNTLANFGVYASEFKGLQKAMPAIFAFRDGLAENARVRNNVESRTIVSKLKEKLTDSDTTDRVVDMLDDQITRFFYGGEIKTRVGNQKIPVINAIRRITNRIFRYSQARVLQFNIKRLPKNIMTNILNAVYNRSKFGLTRTQMLKGIGKGFWNRSDLIGLERGKKKLTDNMVQLMYFRAIPQADPTKIADKIHAGNMYRYGNLDNLSTQVFGYTEMASTMSVYEGVMAKTTVPMVVNGQLTHISLKDAYDVIDGVMVPKEGVFNLEQNKMRTLINERNELISNYIASKNKTTYESLTTSEKIELSNLTTLKAKDVEIEFLEKQNALKREKLRNVEQYVRDQIFQLYTSTQGNYFGRGRSTGETMLAYNVLMSMKRWWAPAMQNKYGGTRYLFNTNKLERGHYRTFSDVLLKKIQYLTSKNRVKLGTSELEKEGLVRTLRDSLNTAGIYGLTYLLTQLALSGGDDDDESDWLAYELALHAFGVLDEYSTLNPAIASTTFYNKLVTEPLKQYGTSQGVAKTIATNAVVAWAGQSLQSLDDMISAIGLITQEGGPFAPYVEQNQKTGGAVAVPKVPWYEGKSRATVAASKLTGFELLLKNKDPQKQLLNAVKYSPIVGFENPLGRLNEIQTRQNEIKEIFDRRPEDILKIQALAKVDKNGKITYDKAALKKLSIDVPGGEQLAKVLKEDMDLVFEKLTLQDKYQVVQDVLSNRQASQAEGVRQAKRQAKLEQMVTGIKKPKEQKSLAERNAEAADKAYDAVELRLMREALNQTLKSNPNFKKENKAHYKAALEDLQDPD
jgi:hypothetical protein